MNVKEIIAGCQLVKEGKPLVGEPVSGTIAVRPISGGPFVQVNDVDVVEALSRAYPKCRFLFLATPVKAPESASTPPVEDKPNLEASSQSPAAPETSQEAPARKSRK